ncbi:MAG: pyridoxal 5'-phosphate synthase glutaminase subunit PdxT [Candidatus Micrarchaeota archaeon]
MKTIGVLGLQGDVIEHIEALKRQNASPIWLENPSQLKEVDALIIPGGESTTIGNLIVKNGLFEPIRQFAKYGKPIWGTCAGAILLAKEGDSQVRKTHQPLLKLMDMKADRNAFGRQRESFEIDVELDGITGKGNNPFPAVFIRAPVIEKVWGNCKVLGELDGKIIAAQQKNLLATCFHPELTDDLRVHDYFLGMI